VIGASPKEESSQVTTSRRSSGSMRTGAWRIKKKVVADLTITTFVIYVHSATSATYFAYPIRK
jgi:hypothetical protein